MCTATLQAGGVNKVTGKGLHYLNTVFLSDVNTPPVSLPCLCKMSRSLRAAGSNLQMVRPSLMSWWSY